MTLYREPVVHEIPLSPPDAVHPVGADEHNAPGKPNAPDTLREWARNASSPKALAAKMPACQRRCRRPEGRAFWCFSKRLLRFTN